MRKIPCFYFIVRTFFILLFLFSFPRLGITSVDTARFNKQLSQYETNFKQLMITRGYSRPAADDWQNSSGHVTYLKLRSLCLEYAGIGKNYDQNQKPQHPNSCFGFLFYFHENDSLFGYLIRSSGSDASFAIHMKPDSLIELERELKYDLQFNSLKGFATNKRDSIKDRGPVRKEQGNENINSFEECIGKITSYLLPKSFISNLSGIKFLEVIPVLNISSIPFYLLKPYSNPAFLVDSMCVVIGHNPGHFMNISGQFLIDDPDEKDWMITSSYFPISPQTWEPTKPLIIGNPSISTKCGSSFSALPGAQKEAFRVGEKINAKVYTGMAASKENVLRLNDSTDFIYFACHAYSDPINPMTGSYLLLADNSNGACGYLTPKEIQNDTLKSGTIVILSACESGLGKPLEAGVIGISRGFINAGAQNVIFSMWPVEDEATSDLMSIFMDELFIPQPFFPAENLHQAILKYKLLNPDPAAWGAFASMGVPYPLWTSMNLVPAK